MDYSQILLEMLDRIKTLENKVKTLEGEVETLKTRQTEALKEHSEAKEGPGRVSAKYRGLAVYLKNSGAGKVVLTYAEIERILGFALPETARKFKQAYWANTEMHSYASAWMAVGYRARVDTESDTVTFLKDLD